MYRSNLCGEIMLEVAEFPNHIVNHYLIEHFEKSGDRDFDIDIISVFSRCVLGGNELSYVVNFIYKTETLEMTRILEVNDIDNVERFKREYKIKQILND